MITCLGLVVDIVKTPYKEDVLRQCYEFLKTHKNLCKIGTDFIIDDVCYATVVDYVDDEYGFAVCFCDNNINKYFIG